MRNEKGSIRGKKVNRLSGKRGSKKNWEKVSKKCPGIKVKKVLEKMVEIEKKEVNLDGKKHSRSKERYNFFRRGHPLNLLLCLIKMGGNGKAALSKGGILAKACEYLVELR